MDLEALYDRVKAVMDRERPGRSFMIGLDIWRHLIDGHEDRSIEVTIWDERQHYRGRTPELALASFLSAVDSQIPDPDLSHVLVPGETEASS